MKLMFAAAIAAVITAVGYPAWAQPAPAPAPSTSPAGKTASEKNAQMALEKAGYTQVTNVKSSPEGVTAKAMKDGKPVSVVVDTTGKIKERPPAP
ncbi:PepSY domain-containing protein [Vineibacter terrae]|uniref:PepSY domain-containing protein n=1 Tax=Vineibacter terrae TaxID=2586908 RepID=UPI002E2EC4B9|nr:PepSY domain-containing protein [Vineibacter terrae]HEX2888660.1 PepSY domain-containing protein [Vineibacter terrae]